MQNMNKNTRIGIGVLIVVGFGLSFFGGYTYGKKSGAEASIVERQQMFRAGGAQAGGRRSGGRTNGQFINGDIVSKDDKSVTIKSLDGGSKIVYYSASTTIGKSTTGTVSDLVVGKRVMVGGAVSGDGTVSAQSIQIRPEDSSSTPFMAPAVRK